LEVPVLLIVALIACTQEVAAPEAPPVTAATPGPAEGAPEAAGADADGWRTYGTPFQLEAPTLTASTLLDAPAQYVGQRVRVTGEVADVCQKKGCWMVVADGERTMRVNMKDHGFGVDRQSTNGQADIEGIVTQRAVDPEHAAHLASEAQHPERMPESGKDVVFEIEAHSVRVKRAS
jgi:hypothetical protein